MGTDSIKNDECYVVEWWDGAVSQWRAYAEFLDRADAEKKVMYLVGKDMSYMTRSKYRIVRKTIKQEIVYES